MSLVPVPFRSSFLTALLATAALGASQLAVPVLLATPATAAAAAAAATAAAPVKNVTERPDVFSASVAAKTQGHRVEVTGLRTDRTTTWVNPDGTQTLDTASRPVRVQQGAGWAPVDATLVQDATGVHPTAEPVSTILSTGGTAPIVSSNFGLGRLLKTNWASSLPSPTLAGDTATYPNVLPGADLTVTDSTVGYEFSLLLRQRPTTSITSLKIPLQLSGLTATLNAGNLLLTGTDGKLVAQIVAPTMYDASTPDRFTARSVPIGMSLSGSTLTLTVDNTFLTDPATVYPVTVDPTVSYAVASDTYIQASNPTTNFDGNAALKTGSTNNGTDRARSLLTFGVGNLAGKHVQTATLNMWNYSAGACYTGTASPDPLNLYRITAPWSPSAVTWNTNPTVSTVVSGTQHQSRNNGTGCPAGTVATDLTGLTQAWANGTPNYGLEMYAASDAGTTGYRFYYSSFHAAPPTLSVTYNSIPSQPVGRSIRPCTSCGVPVLTTSTVPQLTGNSTDADGGSLRYDFEVYAGSDPNPSPAVLVSSGSSALVPAGTSGTWQVPSGILSDGSYEYRVRAWDGIDFSPWSSGYSQFTVDTAAPTAASVSSTAWPVSPWAPATTTSGTIAWTDADSSVASYQYWLDSGDKTAAASTTTSTSLTGLSQGLHTFHLQALDAAGNPAQTVYTFGIGNGTVTSPVNGARTQDSTALSATPPDTAAYPYVRYWWAAGTLGSWTPIPPQNVKTPTGTTPTVYPNNTYSLATDKTLNWKTVSDVTTDQLIQVQACFAVDANTPPSICTAPNNLQVARTAFGASQATSRVGPGEVSLLTGDFSATATDAQIATYGGSLSVSRTSTTLNPPGTTGTVGVVGKGWNLSLPDPGAGHTDQTLTDTAVSAGYVTLTDATGSTSVYTAPTSTIYPRIYTAVGDASDGSVFTQTAATTFTLADTDGAVTSWSSTGASSVNRISGVTLPGVGGPSYLYSGSQLVSVTAQAPPGLSCATPLVTVGCRSLTFLYGAPSSSDPSLTEPAGMVDAAGLLAEIDAVIPDPASNTEITVPVARYGYDSNSLTAHLLGEWDPRIPSGKLVTNYSYDTAGRLASVTPPGLNGWNLHYDDVNLGGRLGSVTRTDPANGTATTTIAYGVALSGSGLPTLDATTVGTWNQTDLPVTGTAVFSPDHPLTVAPTSSDWPYANLSFLDVNGREVNTASYGAGAWQIDTTNYDPFGNPVSTLTADNRNQALTPVAGTTDPAVAAILTPAATASAARAQALSTISTYTADGAELVDSYGPTHPVLLADNVTKIDARSHSHQVYDENHPAGGPFDLVTTSTSSAQSLDLVDHDTHTTISGYNPLVTGDGNGWTLRTPTTVTTVVPGGPNNTRSTRFDTSGRTVETRLPAGTADATGAGNDARSTLTSYYTATGTGPCVSAIYAGQPCQTQAAAAATGSQPVLTVSTVTGYNRWLAPQASTETGAAGALLRSSSTTFDAAGRPIVSHQATTTNVTGGGTSTSQLPDTTDVYDPNTGLPTATTQNGGTVALTTGYDALGRAVSYTDSTGNATTTAYDIDGRPITRTDGKGTYGYSYDNGGGSSSNEHRGLLTSLDTGITAAGYTNHPYVATYDAAGRAVKTTLPNLDLANATFDNAGQQTSLAYTGVGLGDTLSFTANYDSLGRKATLGGPVSTKTFTYAPVGELATSSINTAGACVSKSYSYDPNSNRTGYATNSTCTPSTGTLPLVHSYDSADRLIDPGTSYDQLGRTGTAPAATITGGADATLQYFDNDMVQKQTQGGHTQTFTLDPSQHRILTQADSASGTSTNYYADSSDSPAWTANPTGYTRNIDGLSGLGAIQAHTTSTGTDTIALQVSDLQGNVVTTVDDTPNAIVNGCADYDPFGASIATTTAPTRYGWLGGHQRATDDLAGLTLMGYRLYNPLTGRFLQTDPIPGGSANSYDYADQDPVNQIDLSGRSLSGDGGRSYQPLSKTTIRQMLRTLGAVGCHGTKTITCTVLLGASDEDKDAINRGAEKFFNNLTGGYGLKPSEKRHGMTRALNGDGYFGAGRYQLRGWAKTSLYATMEIHLDSGQKIKIHFQGTHDLCACDGPEMFGLFE